MFELIYDVDKLRQILKTFNLLTHASICIMDLSFETIACYTSNKNGFCSCIRSKDPKINKLCSIPDSEAVKKCLKEKKSITYTCHAGIVETITPIYYNDVPIGYIIFGALRDAENKIANIETVRKACKTYGLIFNDFKKLFQTLPPFTEDQLNAYIEILNLSISQIISQQLLKPNSSILSAQITNYIRSHLTEDLSLEKLCKTFYISEKKLYQIIKNATGQTVNNYITLLRIENAKNILISSDKPISEVAIDVGFYDYNYFIKVFKSKEGITPLSFRKTNLLHFTNK